MNILLYKHPRTSVKFNNINTTFFFKITKKILVLDFFLNHGTIKQNVSVSGIQFSDVIVSFYISR